LSTFHEHACRLEEAIWQVAIREFGGRARKQREVVRAVLELSESYNRGQPPGNPGTMDLLASLVFFTVADMPKAALPLAELTLQRQLRPAVEGAPLRVLDVGAGCGGMTLGLLGLMDALGLGAPLEVTAVDSSARSLELMAMVIDVARREEAVSREVRLNTRCHNLTRGLDGDGEVDLILVGNLLNELPSRARLPLVRRLLQRLSPGGHLLAVEPALKPTARDLHALRDAVLAEQGNTVFGPCTRKGPCPALCGDRDWCVEKRPWRPPTALQRLIHASGLRRQNVTFAYLSVNRHGATASGDRGDAWRVVSKPLRSKGKRELYLCGEPGRLLATRLNRHRSSKNNAMERLRRGHLVWLEEAQQNGEQRLVLTGDTTVQSEDPADPRQWME